MKSEHIKKISDILLELDQRSAFALAEKRYDDAFEIYEEILKAERDLKLDRLIGHTLLNMANICMIKAMPEKALEYIDEAANMKELQADAKDRGNIQISRANCLFLLNRGEEAEKVLTKELMKNRDHLICGQIECILFSYYMRTEKNTKARGAIDKAIQYFELDNNKEELKKAIICRIELMELSGQKQYAELDRRKLEEIEKKG